MSHQLSHISHLSECFRIGQSMITLVWSTQSWVFICISIPIKVATIHNYSAHLCCMAIHIFRGGMCYDVCSPLKWSAIDRCGKRIVYNQGNAFAMCDTRKLLYVKHVASRIGDGFAKQCLCIIFECCLNFLFRCFGRNERTVNTQFLHRHTEEIKRSTIYLARRNDMVACLTYIKYGIEISGLARRSEHGSHSTFQCGNLLCHGVIRGVLQSRIEIALFLQVEEHGHFFGVVIFKCCTLNDRKLTRLTILGFPTTMNTQRRFLEILFHFDSH